MKKSLRYILSACLILMLVLMAAGCTNQAETTGEQPAGTAEPQSLTLSVAASLTDAMEEVKQLYSSEKPEVDLTLNFGSSGALQQQIEQGAPADIFISAAPKQMNALEEKDLLLEGTRTDLLQNKVVLIVPKDADDINDFEDLTSDAAKVIAIGAPESVPAGKYAQEVLQHFNLWEQVESKLVLAKDVRQVLAYVETEDANAGFVYETDAKISDKVKITALAPDGSHAPVVYPAAILKDSKNKDAAADLMTFLTSDKAKTVFEKYGFTVLN